MIAPSTRDSRQHVKGLPSLFLLAIIAIAWFLPVLWTVSLSLRPEEALVRSTSGLLPIPFTLENYQKVLISSMVPRWFLNSVVVSVIHTVLVITVSALAAYAFARIPFKGKRIAFPFVLVGLMVPTQVTYIPLYLLFAQLGWHNSYQALILPNTAAPFGVFLLTQFFRAIPKSIEEAARLDGASELGILFRIMIPLSLPALAVLAITQFTGIWNDFTWPLLSATRPEWMTITVGLSELVTTSGAVQFLGQTLAAAWAGAIPVILFFLFFQKRLIRGVTVGVDSF